MLAWDIITRINVASFKSDPRVSESLFLLEAEEHTFLGLLYLIHKEVFKDSFVPHEPVTPDRQDSRSMIADACKSWFK